MKDKLDTVLNKFQKQGTRITIVWIMLSLFEYSVLGINELQQSPFVSEM